MNGTQENLKFEFVQNVIAPIGIKKKIVIRKMCECGCGGFVNKNKRDKSWNKFLIGHWAKTQKVTPNPVLFKKDICEIGISDKQRNIKMIALIDIEDYDKIKHRRWNVDKDNYVVSSHPLPRIKLHNLILPHINGVLIDHIDRNPLNNQKLNLRFCNHSENLANSKLNKNNSSGHKGVYHTNNKWAAYIQFNNKRYHLGYFDTIEEAVVIRNNKAIQIHGKFATF